MQRTADFYIFQTGVGTNILIMTVISFIVGLSISGQTFYTFILENLERFGALKAIGTKSRELVGMILFQAGFHGTHWLRAGGRAVHGVDLAGQAGLAELCSHDDLREPSASPWYGRDHHGDFQLCRSAAGSANRAVRYLPRMICRT